jgi:hypothetical protein
MTAITIRTKPLRAVEFVCPQCGVDRPGTVVDQRRWMSVLGVPLVPLAVLDPMVECAACAHRCGIGVLTIPTSATLGDLLAQALRHAIASVLRAGDSAAAPTAEVERRAVAMMRNAGFGYDRFDLDHDLAQLRDAGTAPMMLPLSDELTAHGKQSLLHRLYGLAAAGGGPTRAQLDLLVRIGVALGMAAPHINGVLAVARRTERADSDV